jgi:formylglycine-generating enzyme required for sulfatase activity
VDNNAEIWINGELQGNGSWTGDLAAGDYVFEARLEHHRSVIVSKHISSDSIRQTIAMEAPTPIYGSLHVSSIPDSATVYIDEQLVGNTPLSVQQCLIGEHNVRISKKDYGDYRSDVMILEDSMMVVEGALRDLVNVAITCNVVEAQLFVDGQAASPDSGVVRMDMGVHKILMMAEGYDNYIDTIEVTQDRQMFHFEMTANKEEKLTFMVNEVAFTMIPVQGGSFIMGATPEQLKSDKDEHPVHQVTLSDYYIGETEVTQALWKAVMGVNPSEVKDSRLPVDRVSWEDCQMFVERLNALTGKSFRLPTEAEWEFAARGGNHSCGYQYSGSNRLSDVAWYGGNSCNANHFVKTKNPNELGVYDMSGNVWEWCQDWKAAYSNQAETNPTGASSGISRVIRGGSWFNNAVDCRTANRNFDTPNSRYVYLGLRLAL